MAVRTSPRRVVAVLLFVIPLSQVGLDVYTPALPKLVTEFAASNELVQNTVTAYMLGMSVAFIPIGLLADAVGRKRVLVAALGVVVVASLGCVFALNLSVLLGMRFAQGVGGGACLLLAATVAADTFRGSRLVAMMGMLGAAWGSAPVLAPAVGGLMLQFASWRAVFALFAVLAPVVLGVVAVLLPETPPPVARSRINVRAAGQVVRTALRHRIFLTFVAMFALIGAAQMVYGVVAPFLYETDLGFSPAAYGMIALVVGVANLLGELGCGALAARIPGRRLALIGWAVLIAGGLTLVGTGAIHCASALAITVGGGVALLGCGVLDPQSKGLALGVFTRNLGLIAGLVNTCCYLTVSVAMALMAYLPENTPEPLGGLYVGIGVVFVALVMLVLPRRTGTPAHTSGERAWAVVPGHAPTS
ncbi:MAG TPA: MFS transporter [Mycobacterium sp.]|nr:MFS transporter [Mycobacterium sp.]